MYNNHQQIPPDHIYLGINDEDELNDLSTHSLNQLLSSSTYVNQPLLNAPPLNPVTLPESKKPQHFPSKPPYLQQQFVQPTTSLVPLSYDHGYHHVDHSEMDKLSGDFNLELNGENNLPDSCFPSHRMQSIDSFADHAAVDNLPSGYTIHNPTALLLPENYHNYTPTCQPSGPRSPPTHPSATYPLSSSVKSTFKSNIDLSSVYNNNNCIESSPLFHRSTSFGGASKQEQIVQQPTVSDLDSVTSDNGFDFDQFDPPEFTAQDLPPINHLQIHDTISPSNSIKAQYPGADDGAVSLTNGTTDLNDVDLELLLSPERPTYVNQYLYAEPNFRNSIDLSIETQKIEANHQGFLSSRNNVFCDSLRTNASFDSKELDEVMNGHDLLTDPDCLRTSQNSPPKSPKLSNPLHETPVVNNINKPIEPNELFRQSTSNGPGDTNAYRWGTANKYITTGTLDLDQLPTSLAPEVITSHNDFVPRVYHTIQLQSLANDLKMQAQAHEKELARAQSESHEKLVRLKDRIISLETDLDQANHQLTSVAELRRTFEEEKVLEIARVERQARAKYELNLKQLRDQVLVQQQQVSLGTASSADPVSNQSVSVEHAFTQCDLSVPSTDSITQTDEECESLQVLVDAAIRSERQRWQGALNSVLHPHFESISDTLASGDPMDYASQIEIVMNNERLSKKDYTDGFQQTDPDDLFDEERHDDITTLANANQLTNNAQDRHDSLQMQVDEEIQALQQKIHGMEIEHARELEHIAMKWQIWQEAIRDECKVVIGSSLGDLREALAHARTENEQLRVECGQYRGEVHAVKLRARSVVYKVREQYTNRLNALQLQVGVGQSQDRSKSAITKPTQRTLKAEHVISNRVKQRTSHSHSIKRPPVNLVAKAIALPHT